MKGCGDESLGNFAKMESTQHQWKFESCRNEPDFPLNVKTFYRSFAADQTIITEILVNDYDAKSEHGAITLMDHYLLEVKWLPGKEAMKCNSDGFYLLRGLPNFEEGTIPLKSFHEHSYDDLEKVRKMINETWPDSREPIRLSWNEFFSKYLPVNSDNGRLDVEEFVRYKVIKNIAPLQFYLSNQVIRYARPLQYSPLIAAVSAKNEYPSGALAGKAYSMACVNSDFEKLNLQPPRYYVMQNQVVQANLQAFEGNHGMM